MNNVLFFFFTAKWDQCMQVLLAGTAARVPTSSSDGKRKTKKKKKMVKSPNWVLSHFLLGWFHRSRAASPQVTAALWLQGSADNAQPFQWHGREKKKDVWHQPCTLYFNTMWRTTVRRKEKKTNKTKAKVKFPVYRFVCVLTLCCTSRAGRPSFCFFFFFLNTV